MSHRISLSFAIKATLLMGCMSAIGCQGCSEFFQTDHLNPSEKKAETQDKADAGPPAVVAKAPEPTKKVEPEKPPTFKAEVGDNFVTMARREGLAVAALMLFNEPDQQKRFKRYCPVGEPVADNHSDTNIAQTAFGGTTGDEAANKPAYCQDESNPFDIVHPDWVYHRPPTTVSDETMTAVKATGGKVAIIMRDVDKVDPGVKAHVYELLAAIKAEDKRNYLIRYGADFVDELRAGAVRNNPEAIESEADAVALAIDWAHQEKATDVFIVTDDGAPWAGTKQLLSEFKVHVSCFGENQGCARLNDMDADLATGQSKAEGSTPSTKVAKK